MKTVRGPGVAILAWALLALALLASACGSSSAPSSPGTPLATTSPAPGAGTGTGAGTTKTLTYTNATGSYRALVHAPPGYRAGTPVPLYLMVHGCQTTAEQQQAANLLDPLADREGFLVVYPDYDPASETTTGAHPLECWRFYESAEWRRGVGDADAIASLVRMAMAQWSVDPERVYAVGMSSGAFEVSVLGAAYPDLFAAMAIVAGGPYASTAGNAFTPAGPSLFQADAQSQLAFQAMSPYARALPFIEIHGDADTTVYPGNGDNAVQQWLMTDNLAAAGATTGPYPLAPTTTAPTAAAQPGGYPYATATYRDPDGCVLAQHVVIQGMNHFWPGGSTDPAVALFTDPRGPSGAELTWAFLKRYRKSETSLPCSESRAAG